MNIDPETGKNYGSPPTAQDVRNFAAELDSRCTLTQREFYTLRLIADEIHRLREMTLALNDEAKNLRSELEAKS